MTFKSEIDHVSERQSIDATSPPNCLELTSSDPNPMEHNMAHHRLPIERKAEA